MSNTKLSRSSKSSAQEVLQLLEEVEEQLQQQKESEDSLLTIDEVAEKLRISTRSVEKEIAAGRLNPLYVRSQRRFTRDMVNRYLDTYCKKPR